MTPTDDQEWLRLAAEKKVRKPSVSEEELKNMSPEYLRRMVQELQVYQIELEMQNETLRQTQAELQHTRDKLRQLYEHAPVGYVSLDVKGIIRSANQTAVQFLAATPGELIGKGFSTYVDAADREKYFDFFKTFQQHNSAGWEEVQLVQANGVRFYSRLEGKLMLYEKGQPVEILLCLSDISEKKQAEAELSKTRDQLRELADHLQSVREEERLVIAREIHDELGQVLSYVKMGLSDVEAHIPGADTGIRDRIRNMKHSLANTIKTTKALITRLRPYMLDELGLVPALEQYTRDFRMQTGIEVDLFVDASNLDLEEKRETALFRITQEALSNVARHSQAQHVVIHLSLSGHKVMLEISDDGMGIRDMELKDRQTCGLLGMRERAMALGGDVEIQSGTKHGTRLTAWIPA